MRIFDRRHASLDDAARGALARALEDPIFEVLPLKNLADQVPDLPAGALVSITASPAKGIEATVSWAARLASDGYRAIPHFSARMIRDRAHLEGLLAMCREAGLARLFVVGGDADEPGEYLDALSLLRAMDEIGHPFEAIGITGYPQGHPFISDEKLRAALHDKAPWAHHATTQMDFDTKAIARWVRATRAEGFTPPIVIGVPGVADPQKLVNIAARIGVKDAKRFLLKNVRFVAGLAKSGGFYKPTRFVEELAPLLADPAAKVEGFHLYTFNAVGATEAWRQEMLERLGSAVPAPASRS
jgi:methylenetetrahydrofolate reductase (NADPH)